MSYHIITEIRRMECNYQERQGGLRRGELICLDANAEARLAAYIVSGDSIPKEEVIDILENGIRHLELTICGMQLRFDCKTFCIF